VQCQYNMKMWHLRGFSFKWRNTMKNGAEEQILRMLSSQWSSVFSGCFSEHSTLSVSLELK
ncbi:hypothetical protein KIL84_015177, partial [Mauremys mutica]